MTEKLYGKFMFNFLAANRKNAADIMEAGRGYVVPGITSEQFVSVSEAVQKVKELKSVTSLVAVGLGGGGKFVNWKKVLDISLATQPGHLNQPFEKAAYAKGFLASKNIAEQVVNALVWTTGTVGKIKLSSGSTIEVDAFLEIAKALDIESIKLMPIHSQNLDELVYLTERAAAIGIRGIEIAGDIDKHNIKQIIDCIMPIDIEFFMPHIFTPLIDQTTGETMPEKVKELLSLVES